MWNVSCWRLQRQETLNKFSDFLHHTHRLSIVEILMEGGYIVTYWISYYICGVVIQYYIH